MEILEILKSIRKELKNRIHKKGKGFICPYALCRISNNIFMFEDDNTYTFSDYLHNVSKNRKVFYTYKDKKTTLSSQFHWVQKNYWSRLKWLDKQIKIESK